MSRSWNGKAVIDQCAERLWDTSTGFRDNIINWINEIQDDLASQIPLEWFKFKLKKLLPVNQEIMTLNVERASAPTLSYANLTNTLLYNTETAANYTYNSSIVSFGASNATLSLLGVQGDEVLVAPFYSDANTLRAAGSYTAALGGSASITGNVLNCTTSGADRCVFTVDSSLNLGNVGCVRFKVTPGYSGSPGGNVNFFTALNSGTFGDGLEIIHLAGGSMRMTIKDSSGSNIVSATLGSWSPTEGTTYEMELNWDVTTGASRLFIDGAQNGSTQTGTGSRSGSTINQVIMGSDNTFSAGADASYSDLQIFDAVQHTAAFASEVPRVVNWYSSAEPAIALMTGFTAGQIQSFTATVSEPTDTNVGFILNVDGTDKWYNASNEAWEDSNGTYAQSNTAADVNTYGSSLITTSGTLIPKAILNNDSRISTPSITSVVIVDRGGLVTQDTYKACVTFVIYDDDGEHYIESQCGTLSSEFTADLDFQSLDCTLPTLDLGDTTPSPTTIYRRLYVAKKASGESSFGEPFFVTEIQDNSTTTTNFTSDPTSTITPPSDTEIDQVSEDHPFFQGAPRYLTRVSKNRLRRYDPTFGTAGSPDSYDYMGTEKIILYPKLAASATTTQRTLNYFVYRRPHEVFYEVDREIDLPIAMKRALIQGVIYRAYDYKDRAGAESEFNKYEELKRQAINKLDRVKGRVNSVRDVEGDSYGFEVV